MEAVLDSFAALSPVLEFISKQFGFKCWVAVRLVLWLLSYSMQIYFTVMFYQIYDNNPKAKMPTAYLMAAISTFFCSVLVLLSQFYHYCAYLIYKSLEHGTSSEAEENKLLLPNCSRDEALYRFNHYIELGFGFKNFFDCFESCLRILRFEQREKGELYSIGSKEWLKQWPNCWDNQEGALHAFLFLNCVFNFMIAFSLGTLWKQANCSGGIFFVIKLASDILFWYDLLCVTITGVKYSLHVTLSILCMWVLSIWGYIVGFGAQEACR